MATLPNVPPIPDADRYMFVNAVAPVSTLGVTFPVFGAQEDIEVFINNVLLASNLWTLTSASGTALNLLPLPLTDGIITFVPAIPAGATITVVGNWQARQVIQPTAPGISRREFNQTVSTLIASLREVQRAIRTTLQFTPTDSLGDGFYTAAGDLISNVGDAVSPKDAVNLETLTAAFAVYAAAGGTMLPVYWPLTGDGATVTFNIAGTLVPTSLAFFVSVNGLMLNSATDFTVNPATQQITFTSPPANGAAIVVRMFGYARAVTNISTLAQALAGTDDTTYMSPLKVFDSIQNQLSIFQATLAVLNQPTTAQIQPVVANFLGSTAYGRLTLTTGVPVLSATVTAAASVLFTPYGGNTIPNWNGSNFSNVPFSELSNVLANSAVGNAGPAAAVAGSLYDLFVWQATLAGPYTGTTAIGSKNVTMNSVAGLANGQFLSGTGIAPMAQITGIAGLVVTMNLPASANGTPAITVMANTLTRGPAWSSSTARSLALSRVQGMLVNSGAITNGPTAGDGVYVGTIMTDAGGATVTWNLGGAASGGSAAWLGLWNNFNRVEVSPAVTDNGAGYAYATGTWRQARASNGNQINFVIGQNEDAIAYSYTDNVTPAVANGLIENAVGLDSTTAPAGAVFSGQCGSSSYQMSAAVSDSIAPPVAGQHFLAALENAASATSATFNVNSVNRLSARLRM